jgi:hypothetical protein
MTSYICEKLLGPESYKDWPLRPQSFTSHHISHHNALSCLVTVSICWTTNLLSYYYVEPLRYDTMSLHSRLTGSDLFSAFSISFSFSQQGQRPKKETCDYQIKAKTYGSVLVRVSSWGSSPTCIWHMLRLNKTKHHAHTLFNCLKPGTWQQFEMIWLFQRSMEVGCDEVNLKLFLIVICHS